MHSEFACVVVDSCAVDFELDQVAEIGGLLAVAAFAAVAGFVVVAAFDFDAVESAVAVEFVVVDGVVAEFEVAAADCFAVAAGAETEIDHCLKKSLIGFAVSALDGTVFEAAVADHSTAEFDVIVGYAAYSESLFSIYCSNLLFLAGKLTLLPDQQYFQIHYYFLVLWKFRLLSKYQIVTGCRFHSMIAVHFLFDYYHSSFGYRNPGDFHF